MLAEHGTGGPVLKVELDDPLVAGQSATLHITCQLQDDAPLNDEGILMGVIGHVIDVNLTQFIQRASFETGQTTVTFDVPNNLRYDLHKIWIAWVQDLDVSYAQGTFSILPPRGA